MPRKAIDYKKAVIYTIKSFDSVYVGSTTNFTNRKNQHKHNIYNPNDEKYNRKLYKTIRENNFEYDIKPYKEYPCENKIQLTIEEERLRKELNADLNSQSCGTGLSKKDYNKQRSIKNKDKIAEYHKQYHIENKDKKSEYNIQYRIKNKDKMLEKAKQKTTCECGCVVIKCGLLQHKKTNKHLKLMNNC